MGFADQVAAFGGKTEDKMTRAVRKIALDAFSSCILMSPVDTGRFRGNWLTAVGTTPAGTVEALDPSGSTAIGRVESAVTGFEPGAVIYLANNLPYAERLENGWSKQAPAGMVRMTQQRFKPIADAVIAAIGRE